MKKLIIRAVNEKDVFAICNKKGELVEILRCPICGFNYNHFRDKPEYRDGEDNYKAWKGRGDAVKIKFWGECGHDWSLTFGFHKGNIFVHWTKEAQKLLR